MSMVIIFILVCISNSVVFGEVIKEVVLNEDGVDLCQPECDSKIYCLGEDEDGQSTILHDVQTNRLYSDGTVFVKMASNHPESEILEAYAEVQKTNRADLQAFVDKYFFNETLKNATDILKDFKEDTEYIQSLEVIKNAKHEKFKQWLETLYKLWGHLAKKMPDQLANTSSYIPVPKPFVVAGGRFTEMYYWDSYWILKGLLACKMEQTAKNVIENMVHLVKTLGYIPNGNRIYYQKRSQPPMLIQMAKVYYEATKDVQFIKDNLETFEKEFKWWYDNRRVEVKVKGRLYHLFRYHAVSCHPRPESYREDYDLLKNYDPKDLDAKMRIYTGLRSAAETGWDFSSRHMREPTYSRNLETGLTNMNPQEYAYVDLNSILQSNAQILAEWKRDFGRNDTYDHYQKIAFYRKLERKLLDAIENILWNNEDGTWYDYDLMNGKHRKYFFASNLTPLWSKSYRDANKVKRIIEYLKNNKIISEDLNIFPGLNGVPTTDRALNGSLQQWDYSNLWAPLQSFVVRGLHDTNDEDAMKVAKNLGTAFVNTAYLAYDAYKENPKEMYEKYSTEKCGKAGEGGEYTVPTGFGWTNGYIFELFTLWDCFSVVSIPELQNCTA